MIISDSEKHKVDVLYKENPDSPDLDWVESFEITIFHKTGDEWKVKVVRLNFKTATALADYILHRSIRKGEQSNDNGPRRTH